MFAQVPARPHLRKWSLAGADIAEGSVRANDAGAGCSALDAGKFILLHRYAFSRDVA